MSKKYILIGHKKRHGKDTFAEMLQRHLPNSKVLSFAYPMKDIMADTAGITIAELEEIKNNDKEARIQLQKFGSNKMKDYFGQDVWRNLLMKRAEECDEEYIIVSDFRFPVEVIEGATTVKIYRPQIESEDSHESETALDDFDFDVVIKNDSTLDELDTIAKHFADDILHPIEPAKQTSNIDDILEGMFESPEAFSAGMEAFSEKLSKGANHEVDWDEVRRRVLGDEHVDMEVKLEPVKVVYIRAHMDSDGNVIIP